MSLPNSVLLPAPGTTSKIMRHFRHMKPDKDAKPPDKRTPSHVQHVPKYVQPRDRIKYWNLVPGDIVKANTGSVNRNLLGLDKRTRAEGKVYSIDRERNLLWLDALDQENPRNPISKKATPVRLLEPSKPEQGYNPNHMYVRRPVHYSNLMIQVPTGDDKNPIWTSHIVRRNIRYDHNAGMFKWDRFAVYKDAEGNKIRKKIPWPKQKSSPLAQRADTVTISAVKEESWVPWDPKDPILLPSERPRDSPLSAAYVAQALDNRLKLQQEQNEYGVDDEVRTRTMTELKEALKSGDPKAITAALNAAAALQRSPSGARESSRGANSTYPGFQNRSRPKPIPVAQLPSPSELLQFKKDALQQWSRSSEVAAQIEQGGPTFAADDYLRLSPHAGPLVGNLWRSPITRTSSSYALVVQPPRNPATGQVIWDPTEYNEATSQRHLDSMPIELLMERDLTNPNNQKQRTKRYKERKEAQKQARLEQEDKNRENLALFRKYVQAKQQEREATEKAKEQAEAGAGRS